MYPQVCRFLNIEYHLHSRFGKSIIERTIQYIKKTELNVLMTTFHVGNRGVNYIMSSNGWICLLVIQQRDDILTLEPYKQNDIISFFQDTQ